MVKGVYHIQDPVENLQVRITLREVSGAHSLSANQPHPREQRALFDQLLQVRWQEKIYGPRDVADYMMHKKSSYGRQTQLDSRRTLGNLERSGVKVEDMLSEVMIYSYCNDEPFYPPQRSIVSEGGKSDKFDTYLSHALEPSTGAEDSRQQKVSGRLKRADDSAKYMQICLATGIKKGASGAAITSEMTETVLCSIKLTKSGLLVVSPGFSHVVAEEAQVLHYDTEVEEKPSASTSSLFMNNATINAGIKKGFRLSTHRLRTSAGEEFEFSIENVNGVLSPIETEELMVAEMRKDVALSEQSRGTSRQALDPNDPDHLNKWNHSPVPSPYNQMTSLYAEIVSVSGFSNEDPLYVRYQLLLPSDRSSCVLRSSYEAHMAKTQGGRGSAEPGTPQNPLLMPSDLPSPGNGGQSESAVDLVGHTQVSSSASGTETHCLVNDPSGNGAMRLSMPAGGEVYLANYPGARYLMGSVLMISSALAVYFGPGYPFWLVPALAFWLYLLPGSLPTHPQVTVVAGSSSNKHHELGRSKADFVAAGSHHTVNHASVVYGSIVSDGRTDFGHPFHCDVYVRNSTMVKPGDDADKHVSPSASQATLFFEVFSVNFFKRHTLEGCGYTHVPLMYDDSGSHQIDVDISTWKPIGDHRSRLVDAFLGGGSHLTNVRYMEVPNKGSSAISKFGTRTESSGVIRFKCQTVTFVPTPALVASKTNGSNRAEGSGSGARVVGSRGATKTASAPKRTVEDILSTYKSSELLSRSLSRSGRLDTSGLSTPLKGVSLWGDSDGGSQDEPLAMMSVDRVADIVARARANTESLRNESKDDAGGVANSFTKPRGVPRPSHDSRTARKSGGQEHKHEQKDERKQENPHEKKLDDEEELLHGTALDSGQSSGGSNLAGFVSSDDDDSRQSGGGSGFPYRYASDDDSQQQLDEEGEESSGMNLMDRFEAAGVTKTKKRVSKKGKKEKNGAPMAVGSKGILMGKPLNPVSVGAGGRGGGLNKVFGSDSEGDKTDPEQSQGIARGGGGASRKAALSPLHR